MGEQSAVALRRRIGYVPQHGGLLPHWTVRRNVGLVPTLTGAPNPRAAVEASLAMVGLDSATFGDRFPHELSGGQRQRVSLARALAAQQSLVLLDEPFGALDAISRAEVLDVFAQVREERGFSGMLITHDLATAARLSDRIVVMRAGRVEQEGTAAALRDAPASPYVRTLFERAVSASRALMAVVLLLVAWCATGVPLHAQQPVVVGSKPFGESYLLAEMFAQLLEADGIAVARRPGLGATEVAFRALRENAIDVYPEYTGTGLVAVLRDSAGAAMRADPRRVFAQVAEQFAARYGVRWLPPLGFQNGYAVAVRRETAERLGLRTISDLARAGAELRAGFTNDFIGRPDGLAGLSKAYGLQLSDVRPLAPGVKYRALSTGAVDVIDGYSTDGLLAKFDLVTLEDDQHFFPPYEAAAIVSPRVDRERPDVIAALSRLSDRLTEEMVRDWNRRVEVEQEPIPLVAREALESLRLLTPVADSAGGLATRPRVVRTGEGEVAAFLSFFWNRRAVTGQLALEHTRLVGLSLLAAVLLAVPMGVLLTRTPTLASGVLQLLGVIQTIPSIALLAFMIPLLGIGVLPALVALWLYALLPIARATYSGVSTADPEAVAASEALGTTAWQRLWWVQLPLAAPAVLAGVRTSAVITVGAATLAAFIGAGGLGEPIVTGLGLADSRLILAGAIPAALLAILVDGLLALVERAVAPAHWRGVRRMR